MKQRKIPLRKCVICNERRSKKELVRIVKNNEGEIFVDNTGKANGRGAYICKSEECFKKEEKSNRLAGALKTKIPSSIYETLLEEIRKDE